MDDIIVKKNVDELLDNRYYIEVIEKKIKSLGIAQKFKDITYDTSKSTFVEVPKNMDIENLIEEIF